MLLAYTDQSWPQEVYVHTKLMSSLFTNLFTTDVCDSSFQLAKHKSHEHADYHTDASIM